MYDQAGIVSSALQNSVYWLLDHGCRVRTRNREEKEKQERMAYPSFHGNQNVIRNGLPDVRLLWKRGSTNTSSDAER
ncbi:hypothetical protein VULLAG_LOCUS17698 [Vulpes lagopus]